MAWVAIIEIRNLNYVNWNHSANVPQSENNMSQPCIDIQMSIANSVQPCMACNFMRVEWQTSGNHVLNVHFYGNYRCEQNQTKSN